MDVLAKVSDSRSAIAGVALLALVGLIWQATTSGRTSVSSSAMKSVGYDASSQTLEIEFPNGMVYRYFGVPEAVHQLLMDADSHGRYFHTNIRDNYRYELGE